jgi:hypothetical protein
LPINVVNLFIYKKNFRFKYDHNKSKSLLFIARFRYSTAALKCHAVASIALLIWTKSYVIHIKEFISLLF